MARNFGSQGHPSKRYPFGIATARAVVSLTEEDKIFISQRASELGYTMSDYLRMLVQHDKQRLQNGEDTLQPAKQLAEPTLNQIRKDFADYKNVPLEEINASRKASGLPLLTEEDLK